MTDPIITPAFKAALTQFAADNANAPVTPTPPPVTDPELLFSDLFLGPDGLITNEYAANNPQDPAIVKSPDWVVTSGSWFRKLVTAWSGAPDSTFPNAKSTNGTDSRTFRVITRRHDFGDVAVSFGLKINSLTSDAKTPAQAYDGIHIFSRYQSQYNLYVASVYRRDMNTAIKLKCPGGPDGPHGTYYDLVPYGKTTMAPGAWHQVELRTQNWGADTIRLQLWINGVLNLEAIDNGKNHVCPQIMMSGCVGIRGDNCDFQVRAFKVRRLFAEV